MARRWDESEYERRVKIVITDTAIGVAVTVSAETAATKKVENFIVRRVVKEKIGGE